VYSYPPLIFYSGFLSRRPSCPKNTIIFFIGEGVDTILLSYVNNYILLFCAGALFIEWQNFKQIKTLELAPST
jgi:hypothetical protein